VVVRRTSGGRVRLLPDDVSIRLLDRAIDEGMGSGSRQFFNMGQGSQPEAADPEREWRGRMQLAHGRYVLLFFVMRAWLSLFLEAPKGLWFLVIWEGEVLWFRGSAKSLE